MQYIPKKSQFLSPKDKVKRGDILISMSGSVGLACIIKQDIQAMINQRILKIDIKNFSKDVLVLFLNSYLGKLQFERIGTGGVQTNLSSADILNILIPLLDVPTQTHIESLINQSFDLRAKSKDLLSLAKQKVENALMQEARS